MSKIPGLTYATGALEADAIRAIRRMVTRRGGVFCEYYAPPGYAIDATFRSVDEARSACKALWSWEVRLTGFAPEELATQIEEGYSPSGLFKWYAEPILHFGKKVAIRTPFRYEESRRPLKRRSWIQVGTEITLH